MTQNDTTTIDPSQIFEIKASCEKFLNETQIEIRIFRIEQEVHRDKLKQIIEENDRLKKQLDIIRNSSSLFEETRDDVTVKQCTDNVVEMLQEEIKLFKTENDELKEIQNYLRKTIENHEKEIQSYREFMFGSGSEADAHQNLICMEKLKEELVEKKSQLNEKVLYIETLENQKKLLLDEIELIQTELKAAKMDTSHQNYIEKTQNLMMTSNEEKFALQKSLQQATITIADHMEKERVALQKMGEALAIAEAAVLEKEEVLKSKAILEKERDFLATTIGQVMEEASEKVDQQFQKMVQKINDYRKKLETVQTENEEKLASQKKAYDCIEAKLKRVQDQNKELLHENEKLKKDREIMQKALEKIGIKIHPNGNLLYEDNDDKRVIDELRSEIQQLNQKCKLAINDITHEFQKTVKRLSSENAELKAQIKILRG